MLSFLPIFYFLIVFNLFLSGPPLTNCGIASQKLKAAMQYHGVDFAEEVKPGKWIFERDNQVCTLYSEAFESYYESQISVNK